MITYIIATSMEHQVVSGKHRYGLRSYQQNLFNYKVTAVAEYSAEAFSTFNRITEAIVMNWDTLNQLTSESTEKVIDLHELYELPHKTLLELLLLANELGADIVVNIAGRLIAYQLKNNNVQDLFSEF